jgi:hypothetical protein
MEKEKSYLKGFFVKCLENMSSAKMWMFLLPFIVSSVFMGVFMGFSIEMIRESLRTAGVTPAEMSAIVSQLGLVGDVFIAWCTFNVSLATIIIAVREIFKVKKLHALEVAPDKCDEIHKIPA